MQRLVFWTLLAVTLIVYGSLVGWAGQPLLELGAGPVPDLKVTGYDADYIRKLLSESEPGFAEAYAQISSTWDRIFPILAGITLAYGIWIGGIARIWVLVPLAMMAADLTENTLVAGLLLGGVEAVDPGTVKMASAATLIKWLLFPISALLVVMSFVTKRKQRATG